MGHYFLDILYIIYDPDSVDNNNNNPIWLNWIHIRLRYSKDPDLYPDLDLAPDQILDHNLEYSSWNVVQLYSWID